MGEQGQEGEGAHEDGVLHLLLPRLLIAPPKAFPGEPCEKRPRTLFWRRGSMSATSSVSCHPPLDRESAHRMLTS